MKKIIALLLAGILTLFCFAACSSKSPEEMTESEKETLAEKAVEDYLEKEYPGATYTVDSAMANQVDVTVLGSIFTNGSQEFFTATVSFSNSGKASVERFILR